MRRIAYALLGVVWCIILVVCVLAVNGRFTREQHTKAPVMTLQLSITSPVFDVGGDIPSRYTCDGDQFSPPLSISGVREDAKTLVLIVEDPDVPKALRPDGVFDHWVLFNIPAMTTDIQEGASAGVTGKNSAGGNEYVGPCPPKDYEPSTHRYFFRLYALDTELSLTEDATKADVQEAMGGHILQEALMIGRYKRL